jgi:formyl-CoA transferase
MTAKTVESDFLAGVRVLDFTQFEAGTSCTEVLAWLGAEVVKIENPKTGDPGRRLPYGRAPGEPWPDPYYFHMFNANKKSLTVDLKTSRGLELVKNLLKKADVMAENFAPGTIERLGLGYDAVRELNPAIVYCQIKGFGEGSPYENGLAFDMIAQACGGPISVTGEPDRAPVKPGPSFGDTGTGMLMAGTLLAALYRRRITGEGHRLQLAMQDAMLHYMRTCFATQARTGAPAPRRGGKSVGANNVPSALYPCKPGGANDYVYITTSRANPEHWRRLLRLIGREELVGDPRYDTAAARLEREGEVDAILSDWTRQHTKEEAMRLVSGVGVPAGAVFDTMELLSDTSFEERGILQVMRHAETGPFKMPGWPVQIDGAPPTLRSSPGLGEHNADVLRGWLGADDGEIESLHRDGII